MEIASLIWKIAGVLAGLGGIGALILFSFYKEWLPQPAFESKTKKKLHQKSLYGWMMLSLAPTGVFAGIAIVAFACVSLAPLFKVDARLSLGAVQFLEEEPNILDVTVKNEGTFSAKLDDVEFTVHKIHKLLPMAVTYYVPAPSERYVVTFDKSETTPYQRTVKCPYRIGARDSYRFQIEIAPQVPEEVVDYVYEFSIDIHCGEKTLSEGPFLYMGTVGPYPPPAEMDEATRTTLKSLYESNARKNQVVASLVRTIDLMERQLKVDESNATDEK